MGREIKRVPLDFDWPIDEVWKGYLNPHFEKCPCCNAGYSLSYELVAKHIQALMWDNKGMKDKNYRKITTFLAGREPGSLFGHDSSDAWRAIEKLAELADLPEDWHRCDFCDGAGCHPDSLVLYESWEQQDPPKGEGYQVWETVSKGSPISPVFETKEEMAIWLSKEGYSEKAIEGFIEDGWAPSAALYITPDGQKSFAKDIESLALFP